MKDLNKVTLLFLFFILSSCSVLDSNRVAAGYVAAFKSISNLIYGYENNIDPEVINKIPYASSLVKIGKGPYALMILESSENNRHTWVSADGVYLVTYKGRIIKTAGLQNNLTQLSMPKISWSSVDKPQKFTYYLSYDEPYLRDLKIEVEVTNQGQTLTKLFNREVKLNLVKEKFRNRYIGWEVENSYWVDDKGFVWKSKQFISPKLPSFEVEITKKPYVE